MREPPVVPARATKSTPAGRGPPSHAGAVVLAVFALDLAQSRDAIEVNALSGGIWYEQVNAKHRQQPRFYRNRPACRAART